jgi:hypothetical protein
MLYRAGVKSPEEVVAAGEDRYGGTGSYPPDILAWNVCQTATVQCTL